MGMQKNEVTSLHQREKEQLNSSTLYCTPYSVGSSYHILAEKEIRATEELSVLSHIPTYIIPWFAT